LPSKSRCKLEGGSLSREIASGIEPEAANPPVDTPPGRADLCKDDGLKVPEKT